MQARIVIKNIELDGRAWQLRKFTAMDGIKLGKMIVGRLVPIVEGLIKDGNIDTAKSITSSLTQIDGDLLENIPIGKISELLNQISDDDLDYIKNKCFCNISEMLGGGATQILSANGFYQIPDVEYDPQLFVMLLWEQLKFGLSDFFDGNRWKSFFPTPADSLDLSAAM